MRLELEKQVDDIDQEQDLSSTISTLFRSLWGIRLLRLTTLVPRLILSDWASASVVSLKDQWNAVGSTRLLTLKLNRQALIWVTVLL